MSLLALPNEVILLVAGNFAQYHDLNALCQTNKRLHALLELEVYKLAVTVPQMKFRFNQLVSHGYLKAVDMLCKAGFRTDQTSQSPLLFAVYSKDVAMVKLLLSHGADADRMHISGVTPIYEVRPKVPGEAISDEALLIAKLLIEAGADINSGTRIGDSPLYAAIYHRHPRLVKLFLENGGDIMTAWINGMKPSKWLRKYWKDADPDLIKMLVEEEAKHEGERPRYPIRVYP